MIRNDEMMLRESGTIQKLWTFSVNFRIRSFLKRTSNLTTTPSQWPGSRRRSSSVIARWIALALLIYLAVPGLFAQGTFTALQTGGGQPLVSDQQVLPTAGLISPQLSFDFGFLTGEVPAPGAFLDSFTVTIQDPASDTAVLATVDASGVLWAPVSPGAVMVPPNQIQWQAIPPPSLAPVLGQGVAYSVLVPIPSSFTGSSVTVYFDLFDNEDAVMSLGWFNNLKVTSVPEPRAALLLALGLVIAAVRRSRSR